MQAYQTFYPTPQMNQPNMYPNYSQPMANPYMDRMAQLQQYQQGLQQQQMPQMSQQAQGLVGKVVNDVSMVSPNDVPMDGSIAIFPKGDMAEIYCKQWKQDGTIQTVVYRPVQLENQSEGTNIPQMDFNALNEDVRALREDIKDMRSMIEKSMEIPAVKATRTKKSEVSADE